ncbi:MAG: hypothetical protein ACOYO1_16865 [Bacteroidales bacterium]
MKKSYFIYILLITLLLPIQTKAQNLKKGLKYLAKGEILDAYNIFNEGLIANPNCPISNYGLAVIYSEKKDTLDFFKAYDFILKSKENSKQLLINKDYLKLNDYITIDSILNHSLKIDTYLYNVLLKTNNLIFINRYISDCSNSIYYKNIIELKDSLEFVNTDKNNSISEYDIYLKAFPNSKYCKEAIAKRDLLIFENTKKENTLEAYKYFIQNYSNSVYVKQAKDEYLLLDYSIVEQKKDIDDCKRFINEYPNTNEALKCKELLVNLEYEKLSDSSSINDFEDFIAKYPESKYTTEVQQNIYKLDYSNALSLTSISNLAKFLNKYPDTTTIFGKQINSLYKEKLRLSKFFPNAENFIITFLRKGNLWIMNEDGTSQKQITDSKNVIAFTTKANIIYYSELEGKSLTIARIFIDSNYKIEPIMKINSEIDDYFIANTVESGGEMGWVNSNLLGIGANYECCESAGFRDAYAINLNTMQTYFCSMEKTTSENMFYVRKNNSIFFNEATEITNPYFTKKAGKEYELFLSTYNKIPIKLSSTQKITPRICWEDPVKSISFCETPSNKIIFYVIESCGDLVHAELFIVNKSGTFQKSLGSFCPGYENSAILKCNGEYVTIESKTINGKTISELVSYFGSSNQRISIANDIDYFETVHANKSNTKDFIVGSWKLKEGKIADRVTIFYFGENRNFKMFSDSTQLEKNDYIEYRIINESDIFQYPNFVNENENGQIISFILINKDGSLYKGANIFGPFEIISLSKDELILKDYYNVRDNQRMFDTNRVVFKRVE